MRTTAAAQAASLSGRLLRAVRAGAPLDILRIDLTRGHAILLGLDWTLGIDAL